MFKPYIYTHSWAELINDGETWKKYDHYELSAWGKFINKLLKREKYKPKDLCRVVIGYVEDEEIGIESK